MWTKVALSKLHCNDNYGNGGKQRHIHNSILYTALTTENTLNKTKISKLSKLFQIGTAFLFHLKQPRRCSTSRVDS